MRFAPVVLILIPELAAAAGYAGAKACEPCHAAIFATQSTTGHARALAPSSGSQPGNWAFGAGLQAITFVTRIAPDSYREDGLTWYRSIGGMAVTPGQRDSKGVVFRTFDPNARFLACFSCHSTGPITVDKDEQIVPRELGIRCEVCHGPAAAHVDDPVHNRLRNPLQSGAAGMNRFCGQCHRTDDESGSELKALDDPRNARDQTLRLAASKCFLRSNGRLSCVTCHDPHQPLEQNAASYNARCQGCHAIKVHRRPVVGGACASCHMPKVPVGPILQFANHRIGIYAPANPLVPVRSRAGR